MELKEIVDIIANNSIGLVCLAVMIYSYVTTMNKINDTLSSIEKTQILMCERISKIEDNMTKED
jgi:hypothetical protein